MLGANVMWGLMSPVAKAVLVGGLVTPLVVTDLRIFGAMVLFWVASLFQKPEHVPPRDLMKLFGASLLAIVFNQGCFIFGVGLTSPVDASIITTSMPLLAMVLAAVFLREPITGKKLLALALALLGCALVTGVFTGGLSLTTKGLLFGLGAAFFYALYSIFAPFGLRHYSPLTVVFWTFVFAALGALFVADWGNLMTVLSVPQNALLAAGLVLLSTVAPYILYTKGLANVESGKASIMASIEPVVGTLVGTLVFGEPISAGVFLGLACILACVYILR